MADAKITLEELAEFMTQELPMTFDVFEKNRANGNEAQQQWARGRIDAFLEIIALLDRDREAMLRAEWERVVHGEGFMKDE